SYETRTRLKTPLPPAASRVIVPVYGHAPGALISLALPLGSAKYPPSRTGHPALETRCRQAIPCLLCLRHTERHLSLSPLCGGHRALGFESCFLAGRLGLPAD